MAAVLLCPWSNTSSQRQGMLTDDLNQEPQQEALMSFQFWLRDLPTLKSLAVSHVAAYLSEGLTPAVTEAEKL
jgi:hypothetical protein